MKRATDAVTAQVFDDRETVGESFGFDRMADPVELGSGPGFQQSLVESLFGDGADLQMKFRFRRDDGRSARIREVSTQLGGNIDVHQIPGLENPRTRNAMSGFFIDADAGVTGKVIGELRCRSRPVSREEAAADGVQFRRRDARFELRLHMPEAAGDDSTDPAQAFQIFFRIDGHGPSLPEEGVFVHGPCRHPFRRGQPANSSDFQETAKPSGRIIRFRPVMVSENLVVAAIAKESSPQLSDGGWGEDPTGRFEVEFPQLLQTPIKVFAEELDAHVLGQIQGAVFWFVFFPRVQGLAVIADAPATFGAFGRAITEEVLIHFLVIADDVRFAVGFFHFLERPQLFRPLFQPGLNGGPFQTFVTFHVFFEPIPQDRQEALTLLR